MLCTKIWPKKGINKFGSKGKDALCKELSQLHNREVFKSILFEDLSEREKTRAMNSLIFLTEKRYITIKAKACANGSSQCKYINIDEAANPTVTTEALLATAVIDAKQNTNVMTLDIPNSFVQTPKLKRKKNVL